MQVSIDGMVAVQRGVMRISSGMQRRQYSIANAANVDCILLGNKTATDFIPHWKSVAAKPKMLTLSFGTLMTDIPKVVFSRPLRKSEWPNATVANGEIVDYVRWKTEAQSIVNDEKVASHQTDMPRFASLESICLC